jgi:hypothetical protein
LFVCVLLWGLFLLAFLSSKTISVVVNNFNCIICEGIIQIACLCIVLYSGKIPKSRNFESRGLEIRRHE